MDFGALLHTAQKNEKGGKKEPVRYYSTKFEPPKKEQRNKQQLSANIKRFLAKKEAEEQEKKLEAQKKRDELLALRAKDKKATRRVNVMLKRTKSANQSVLQDAIDSNNTSVTLAGPIQPDEDDYGYVSQEAAAFYNKMMEKYSKMPDEPKFNLNKKKVSTDLNSTKERVKAAIDREREEANMPHKRKRKQQTTEDLEQQQKTEDNQPIKKPKPIAPPPLNFNDLLKLAEKKQFEPIIIEQKPKEEERLFTKKQKKEMEREKEWRDRKESKILSTQEINKIPKLNSEKNQINNKPIVNDLNKKIDIKKTEGITKKTIIKTPIDKKPIVPLTNPKPGSSTNKIKSIDLKKKDSQLKKIPEYKPKQIQSQDYKPKQVPPQDLKPKQFPPQDLKPKQFPPQDLKPKQFPPQDLKPRQFPPKDIKPKQFPPSDVRRKEFPGKEKKALLNKRRIMDDDDYDSEMDDFIDDGHEEGEDYSKYISEIFGYDKSKYRYVDDDVDNMESTFAQQMREEVISTKIGIMEDLEDMRQEEEEKRRKALLKKKRKI